MLEVLVILVEMLVVRLWECLHEPEPPCELTGDVEVCVWAPFEDMGCFLFLTLLAFFAWAENINIISDVSPLPISISPNKFDAWMEGDSVVIGDWAPKLIGNSCIGSWLDPVERGWKVQGMTRWSTKGWGDKVFGGIEWDRPFRHGTVIGVEGQQRDQTISRVSSQTQWQQGAHWGHP